eukprot:PITA_26384
MSLLDGYSRYNQVSVHEDDQDKTAFTTPWGTFHYAKMPFGLKNEGATFQWEMELNFANENDVFLVVYLDDLTLFSKSDEEHMYHLKIVFQKCKKYGLSVNPKKSLFTMEEGKLLEHIISKDGIRIDLARVQAIQQIDLPWNKKEVQSFNGKMNFLCQFVPNLAEHLREMTNMLKKDSQVKWMEEDVKSFNLVKLALFSALVLVSPDYTQDFILFSFTSEHTMAAALKDFRVYILHSHILAYVPNATAKDVLVQTNLEGRRGKWITALLEYDLEIKPTKLVKGQGLAKLMAKSNLHALDINLITAMSNENEEGSSIQISKMFTLSPWYSDIIHVLKNLSPQPSITRNKTRTLKLKVAKFCILNSALYWKNPSAVLLNCLLEKEPKKVMEDFHKGDCGGHIFWKSTTNKILRAGYYWLTFFADAYKMVKHCHKCPIFKGKQKLHPFPLKPIEMDPHSDILFHKMDRVNSHQTSYGCESLNKSLVKIIKKLLEISKKSWHKRLVNALWADRVSQKKSIGTSPFELVYGVDTVFPTSRTALVVKLLHEASSEEDPMERRLNQMVHLQQTREEVLKKTSKLQEKIKKIYDRKAKVDKF